MDRCCFDFLLDGEATNISEKWTISHAPSKSVLGPKGVKTMSLEEAFGYLKTPPGEERFLVQQDVSYHINFGGGS
jgi:hypothetical protein